MRFKTLPIFTLATYRMGLNFSIRVTPNINLITVGLKFNNFISLVEVPIFNVSKGGWYTPHKSVTPC